MFYRLGSYFFNYELFKQEKKIVHGWYLFGFEWWHWIGEKTKQKK